MCKRVCMRVRVRACVRARVRVHVRVRVLNLKTEETVRVQAVSVADHVLLVRSLKLVKSEQGAAHLVARAWKSMRATRCATASSCCGG